MTIRDSTIQDFPSRMDDPAGRRLGTFSYLPPMSRDQVRLQVQYLLGQGWTPAIEHVEPSRATSAFWYLWKLPMFAENDPDAVLAEVDRCHEAHPGDHVRLVGYDQRRQTQGFSLVVHRGVHRGAA